MSDSASDQEYLVLSDEGGNLYAVPRDIVEQHRVTVEQQQQLEKALGEDVSGHSMYQQYMNESRTASYQTERREEAARERSLRGQGGAEASDPGNSTQAEKVGELANMLTGIWRRLPFQRTAAGDS